MKRFLIVFAIIFFLAVAGCFAQEAQPTPDEPKVCVSQSTANACRDAALERNALREYKAQAEKDIAERDRIIEELKIKLAMETQKGIDADAERVRMIAIIEALMKVIRPKKNGLIVF